MDACRFMHRKLGNGDTIMFKHLFCTIMALCLMTCALHVLPALAADDGADPLQYAELMSLTEQILTLASSQEPIQAPSGVQDLTEDGYAFVYDFGTLYWSHPVVDDEAMLLSFTISGEVMACRDTFVGEPLSDLLHAYYCENDALSGDYDHAVLYLSDNLPQSAAWAWVSRDGQRVSSVQYSIHALQEDGQYSDIGLLYSIESGTVDVIRLYGLLNRLSLQDVQATLQLVSQSARSQSYSAVASSYDGLTLTPFSEDDLIFSGIDFLHMTPEDAVSRFGPAIEDASMEDSDGTFVRMMDFGACEIFFRYDTQHEQVHIASVTISQDGLEGPRAVRFGDSFSSVLCRFRFGEGEYEDGMERLYGSLESGEYGLAEYGDDASGILRYYTVTSDGVPVRMMAIFQQMELTELLILRDD